VTPAVKGLPRRKVVATAGATAAPPLPPSRMEARGLHWWLWSNTNLGCCATRRNVSREHLPRTLATGVIEELAVLGGALWVSQKLARRPHKEFDFSREESVHAGAVGGLEGIAPTAKAPRLKGGALGGGSAAHEVRMLNWRTSQWPNLILLTSE